MEAEDGRDVGTEIVRTKFLTHLLVCAIIVVVWHLWITEADERPTVLLMITYLYGFTFGRLAS